MDNESARELIKGKKIAVIGSQKSAIDIAAECAAANGKKRFDHNPLFSYIISCLFN